MADNLPDRYLPIVMYDAEGRPCGVIDTHFTFKVTGPSSVEVVAIRMRNADEAGYINAFGWLATLVRIYAVNHGKDLVHLAKIFEAA